MRLVKTITELVFPQRLYCNCCGKYIDKTRTYGLCNHCIKCMSFKFTDLIDDENREYFNSAAAVMGYGLYERQLIFGLKYNGRTHLAPEISRILRDGLLEKLAAKEECPWLYDDLIVPVPLHPKRLRERGFNQVEKIGEYLSKDIGIPLCAKGLLRVKETKAQRALTAKERQRNMEGVFEVNPKLAEHMKDKNILLLDDICTTGATALSCARVLLDAGVNRVDFLAVSTAKNKEHEKIACQEEAE